MRHRCLERANHCIKLISRSHWIFHVLNAVTTTVYVSQAVLRNGVISTTCSEVSPSAQLSWNRIDEACISYQYFHMRLRSLRSECRSSGASRSMTSQCQTDRKAALEPSHPYLTQHSCHIERPDLQLVPAARSGIRATIDASPAMYRVGEGTVYTR